MCGMTSITPKKLSGGITFVYTKVFSALTTQVPQQATKRSGVLQKDCSQGKKRKIHIYTKEPSRCLWGTPSRSIGE